MNPVRVRFAPSPTGFLHLGGLRTALFNYLFAKKHPESKFILRIEDTDRSRTIPEAAQSLERTLQWCGVHFDESPLITSNASCGPYFQSERLDLYRHYADELVRKGHAYKCYCQKERLESLRQIRSSTGGSFQYDRYCRDLSEIYKVDPNQPFVIRLKVPDDATTSSTIAVCDLILKKLVVPYHKLDDIILMKSDGWPTYHFANVVDDHLMNITHVLRGQVNLFAFLTILLVLLVGVVYFSAVTSIAVQAVGMESTSICSSTFIN